MMNDGSEGRYGYRLFEQAAGTLLDDVDKKPMLKGLTSEFFDDIDNLISPKQFFTHPVIACFSKRSDVLSQWRAYAQNGEGWSVGFRGEKLDAMPITLLDVLYDPEEQLKEVRASLAALYYLWRKSGSGAISETISTETILFASLLHAYKDPTFQEEQEVRALHHLRVDLEDNGWQLVDEGGLVAGAEVAGEPVRFRAAGSSIVAYLDIAFPANSIQDVWFGPRNENGIGNALYPLTHHGHRNVVLNRSASFYRG